MESVNVKVAWKPGLLFVDAQAQHWLSCRRKHPDAGGMVCNLETGELAAPTDVEGLTFVSLNLGSLLRVVSERR